jgi:5-methylcytosine-specific restriction endonuclease McrA
MKFFVWVAIVTRKFTISSFQIRPDSVVVSKKIIKETLEFIQDKKCLMCRTQFCHMTPCDLHHIDSNRQNNTIENLALLCCNCHSAVHRNKVPFPRKKHTKLLNDYFILTKTKDFSPHGKNLKNE